MSPQGRVLKMRFASQAEEIAFLRLMVNAYRELQTVRAKAVWIVFDLYGCPPKRPAAHALAIGDWVQKNIRYVNEFPETFSSPLATLRQGYEDCDGHSILIAALCESIGVPTHLKALGWRDGAPPPDVIDRLRWELSPWGFRHIYCEALVPIRVSGKMKQRALPLDSTMSTPVGITNPLTTALRLHGDVTSLTV